MILYIFAQWNIYHLCGSVQSIMNTKRLTDWHTVCTVGLQQKEPTQQRCCLAPCSFCSPSSFNLWFFQPHGSSTRMSGWWQSPRSEAEHWGSRADHWVEVEEALCGAACHADNNHSVRKTERESRRWTDDRTESLKSVGDRAVCVWLWGTDSYKEMWD